MHVGRLLQTVMYSRCYANSLTKVSANFPQYRKNATTYKIIIRSYVVNYFIYLYNSDASSQRHQLIYVVTVVPLYRGQNIFLVT